MRDDRREDEGDSKYAGRDLWGSKSFAVLTVLLAAAVAAAGRCVGDEGSVLGGAWGRRGVGGCRACGLFVCVYACVHACVCACVRAFLCMHHVCVCECLFDARVYKYACV